jgi:hypothetical protein
LANVTIGGEAIAVALPNFKALKAAWRYIAAAQGESDPMAGIDAILGVISVGKVGDLVSVDELEERLKPQEMAGLRPFMNALMIEVGLARPDDAASGEASPAMGEASPSTETSTPSSPPSSPVSEGPTGTA